MACICILFTRMVATILDGSSYDPLQAELIFELEPQSKLTTRPAALFRPVLRNVKNCGVHPDASALIRWKFTRLTCVESDDARDVLKHALRCFARPCLARSGRVRARQAGVWFDNRLFSGAACSTTLVFGTSPRLPVFAPRHALSQSYCLPSRPVL